MVLEFVLGFLLLVAASYLGTTMALRGFFGRERYESPFERGPETGPGDGTSTGTEPRNGTGTGTGPGNGSLPDDDRHDDSPRADDVPRAGDVNDESSDVTDESETE